MLNRLRSDFQLTILTLFSGSACIGVLPIALYRMAQGEWLTGLVELAIIACMTGATIYAWRSGDTHAPGLFFVVVTTVGTIVAAELLGRNALYWMYATLLSSFLLIDRRLALVFCVAGMLIMGFVVKPLVVPSEVASFFISLCVVSLYAYMFAVRTEAQRLQLEGLATRDQLTGVGNRRAMEAALALAVEGFRRNGIPVSLAMVDLDHFKRVNDQHGHEAGDCALVTFAQLVRSSMRSSDRLFRFGGEEFVLLLGPGCDPAGLRLACEHLRAAVARGLESPGGPITCSIGAAILKTGENWSEWLARADAAMYRAKRSGRDCVVIGELLAAPPPDGSDRSRDSLPCSGQLA
ncbi:MAG: GGDEF domain-containing protein [Lysobacter sp.]|nr:GGDEF domain-containing protein [Lysobacter sp.]MDQ3269797.1 GGDEF domain-containing protein [Pseudomonadota bacterium]